MSRLIKVDFPAPVGPTMATLLAAGTWMVKSSDQSPPQIIAKDMLQNQSHLDILTFQDLLPVSSTSAWIQDAVQALWPGKWHFGSSDKTEEMSLKGFGVVDIIEEGHQLTDSKVRSWNNAYSTKSSHYCINQGIYKVSGRLTVEG